MHVADYAQSLAFAAAAAATAAATAAAAAVVAAGAVQFSPCFHQSQLQATLKHPRVLLSRCSMLDIRFCLCWHILCCV